MFISDIEYLNNDNDEAEVSISDGQYTVVCYAFPFSNLPADPHISYIDAFMCTCIEKSDTRQYSVQKLPQHFAYRLTALVLDKERQIVSIGKIVIHLDFPIPKDIDNGEYVVFSVSRLDFISA